MGPVHLYLAAWVAGGVLLGASMLLDGREHAPSDAARAELGHNDPSALDADAHGAVHSGAVRMSFFARTFRLAPLGLIGFGLAGLTAKGLNLDLWPWTLVCALAVGLSLIALGYGLSRPTSL